jgi:uncharacterized protein
MLNKEEILFFLKEKKVDFFSEYRLVKLGLFGSFASDEASDQSDIDLLIEFLPETENLSEKKSKFKAALMSKFDRDIDLCREKYMKPYFKDQIQKSVIYV